MNVRQIALAALAALACGGVAAAQQAAPLQIAQTPPAPTAPAATPAASPAPSASPGSGRRGRRAPAASPEPSPSETPEPPQFSTMDGVWEVQLQSMTTGRTTYSHLYVTQKGDALTGTWARGDKDKLSFTGTFDGRLFKLTATDAKNATWTLAGYAENFADMVGMLTSADPKDRGTPFTASHRKKERLAV